MQPGIDTSFAYWDEEETIGAIDDVQHSSSNCHQDDLPYHQENGEAHCQRAKARSAPVAVGVRRRGRLDNTALYVHV